jgi:5-methylcytosine-specific restriction protein A
MPITKGHGNPTWTKDETILALDLLYQHGKPLDRRHRDVIQLSDFLRQVAIHPPHSRTDRFRNPDGVALKLQNLFSAVEPGRGLTYSKTDLEIVTAFPKVRRFELAEIAQLLRSSLTADQPFEVLIDPDEVFVEGRWLTSRHRYRDSRLRQRLLKRSSYLKCEICDFTPPSFDRLTQESFFEAHHTVPISAAVGSVTTKTSDMSLLCASCHRFIHKLISSHRRWIMPSEAREHFTTARSASAKS